MPYTVVSFVSAFGDPTLISPLMATIPALVAKSAGLWNPLIYVATNKQFRYGFYAIIPCKGIKDSLVKKEEKQPESSQESDLDEEDDKKNTKKVTRMFSHPSIIAMITAILITTFLLSLNLS